MYGTLQGQDFLLFRLNPQMSKWRLIKCLHTLRGYRNLHTTYLKQRYRAKVDIAIARDRAGGPDFSIAKLLDLKRAAERYDSFGTIAPTEIYRNVGAFTGIVRGFYRLLIAQIAQCRPFRAAFNQGKQQTGRV